MKEFLQSLNIQPTSLVSIALAIISITLACLFYRRSRRSKDPRWAIRNTTLIEGYSSKLRDLEVFYKGDRVEDLSVCRIAFWNDGKATIDRQDIATANPLRIASRDQARILDAKVLATNSRSSQFTASLPDTRTAAHLLEFDYLDHGHGAVLQVVHTGTSEEDLEVVGDIKGSSGIQKKDIRVYRYLPLPTPAEFDKRLEPAAKRLIRGLLYFFAGLYMTLLK